MSHSSDIKKYNTLVSSPQSVSNLGELLQLFEKFDLIDEIKLDCFHRDDLYYIFLRIKAAISTFILCDLPRSRGDVIKTVWTPFLEQSCSDFRLSNLQSQGKLFSLYNAIFCIHLHLLDTILERDSRRKIQPIEMQLTQLGSNPLELFSQVASEASAQVAVPLRKTCGGIVGPGACASSQPCGSTRCADIHLMNAINHVNQLNKRARDAESLERSNASKMAKH